MKRNEAKELAAKYGMKIMRQPVTNLAHGLYVFSQDRARQRLLRAYMPGPAQSVPLPPRVSHGLVRSLGMDGERLTKMACSVL